MPAARTRPWAYSVTALITQTADDDPEGLTENKLRAASQDYPAEITNLYLDLPAGAIGAVIPLWLGTTYMTARTAYHASTKRRVRELEQLADRLAALARELVPQRPALRSP